MTRYTLKTYRRSFWQTLCAFLKTGLWERERREFISLQPGDDGYADAPYQEHYLQRRDFWKVTTDQF